MAALAAVSIGCTQQIYALIYSLPNSLNVIRCFSHILRIKYAHSHTISPNIQSFMSSHSASSICELEA
jgi:hypothetical protein